MEVERAAVELVAAGPRDGVHDPAAGVSILSTVVAAVDAEFPDRVHAQVDAIDTAGRRAVVGVEGDAIEPEAILVGT